MPEGLELIAVFILMLILLVRRVPLVYVLLGGAAVLGVLFGVGPVDLIGMALHSVLNPITIELLMILWFIMILEYIMRKEGYMDHMLIGLQQSLPYPRLILCMLPAFIGLMPSAGGAIFSAPLVNRAAKGMVITPEQKSFVNFYYRHISEFLLPIYPNVLLAATLTGLTVSAILQHMVPFGILIIFLGIPVVRHIPTPAKPSFDHFSRRESIGSLFSGVAPIFVVVFFVLLFGVDVWAIVGLVLLGLFIRHRYSPKDMLNSLRYSLKGSTLLMVTSVMILKGVLEETGSVASLPELMAGLPLSPLMAFVCLFFLLGLLTGFVGAVVGIGFPIVLAAIGSIDPPTVVLLFLSGLAGQMLTPLHLCLTLTTEYFKADLGKVIRLLLAPELTLLLVVNVTYQLLYGGLW